MKTKVREFQGRYRFLSNFYTACACKVEYEFQAAKCIHRSDRGRILRATSPYIAKRLGRSVQKRLDWEWTKEKVMLRLLRKKFSEAKMRDLLLETGDMVLEEGNQWHDTYWGRCWCPDHLGAGKNRLGILLMQVREELRA